MKPRIAATDLSEAQKAALRKKRLALDALPHYEPGPTQKRCLDSRARYRLLDGPNRGGKSAAVAWELAAAARRKHPTRSVTKNGVYLLMAPSREQLKDPWGKKLLRASELRGDYADKPLIPAWEIKKVWKTHGAGEPVPRDIELKNGHRILLAVSGDEDIDKRLKGKMLLGIGIDEDAGTEKLLAELYSRLLDANSDPDIVREAGGGWILWGATDDEANEGFGQFRALCRSQEHPEHEEFTIDPSENLAIRTEEREKLRGVIDAETYAVKHEGKSATNSHLIFQQWNRERHILAEPFQERADDNLWISYDPGWRHPCGIGCFAVNREHPHRLVLVRFYCYKFGTRWQHLESMREWLDGRFATGIVCDPAILKTESNGRSYFSMFEEELKQAGVRSVLPLMIGRNRLDDMIPEMERWLERGDLVVDPSGAGASEYIHEMEAYKWDPKAKGRVVYRKAKGGDEAPDVTKYVISKFTPWQDHGPNPRWGQVVAPSGAVVTKGDAPPVSAEEALHALRLAQSQAIIDSLNETHATPIGGSSYF